MAGLQVRLEREIDRAAVRRLNVAAFESSEEAAIVDRLRARAQPTVSLVAVEAGSIVGHIMFSPVMLEGGDAENLLMGLGPMAVEPKRQRKGIGSRLVATGLECCKELCAEAVVVIGHPSYYPRFGFEPASRFGLRCAFDVPDEAFMAMELSPGALASRSGVIRYHPAFEV